MSQPFLALIDLDAYAEDDVNSIINRQSYIGDTFVKVTHTNIEKAIAVLKNALRRFSVHCDITKLNSVDDAILVLDSGAASVIVSYGQLSELKSIPTISPERLFLSVEDITDKNIVELRKNASFGIHISALDDIELLEKWLNDKASEKTVVFCNLKNPEILSLLRVAKTPAIPIIPVDLLSNDNRSDKVNIADLLTSNLNSDRSDNLISTLVTDERGVALGLVYSSPESISESLKTGRGVYQSRKRGLWYKGETSGDIQELVRIEVDCDSDCLKYVVRQKGKGFCHLGNATCFGPYKGLSRLQHTLRSRKESAPEDSYTSRLFKDAKLLNAKIMEEASELCQASSKENIAFEAADLLYFALTKCVANDVSLVDIESQLDAKSLKVNRRKGDAKQPFHNVENGQIPEFKSSQVKEQITTSRNVPHPEKIQMRRLAVSDDSTNAVNDALRRPSQRSTAQIMGVVKPIVEDIKINGDSALLSYTHKFEKATSLTIPVLEAPFPDSLMKLDPDVAKAIDISFENIRLFHEAQKDNRPLQVETMPGVICSRFSRPIERVGLYVPGGTAVLPSTAMMLGVPAMVASCKKIVFASPPRSDGTITPEIVYIAHKVGASSIVLAGGAQAIAALAYGTQSVSKVDKILGPGNQYVTAAKMLVSNDTSAGVGIDMPAGPSEVLVVADSSAVSAFVASDLLSQAEHGVDSQVILIAVALSEEQLLAIEKELHEQAIKLPRVDIVRKAIEHSVTIVVPDIETAMRLSNEYAPEHLILQVADAKKIVGLVENAGSVFVGPWTPESVGDYSAGVNHSLPTYGYAKQYSGVNLASYLKHITSSELTSEGLRNVGDAVMRLAAVEELDAHRRAVSIRLTHLDDKMSD